LDRIVRLLRSCPFELGLAVTTRRDRPHDWFVFEERCHRLMQSLSDLNATDPHKGIAEALSSGSSVQKLARSRDSRCEKSSEPEQVAVTGDDRIGFGRQSALENPVIGLILVYEIHRLRRMNEDCEVVDRSLRLADARRRPPELSGQDARDLIEDRRRDVDVDCTGATQGQRVVGHSGEI
jgi:hypothetical protein